MEMPRLSPRTVTAASRIMLPAHIIMSTWLGLAWLLQGAGRTSTIPALYSLRHVWPIQGTAIVLIAVGVIGLLGLLTRHRSVAAIALGMAGIAYLGLTVAIIASLIQTSNASFSAPAWPAYIAVAHLASMASLAFDTPPERRRGSAT